MTEENNKFRDDIINKFGKNKNVLLDLDNTLICAEPTEDIFNIPNVEKKIVEYTMDVPVNYYNMDDYYLVFERPYLQEFLDFLFENYNVSIWTAASKDYALFIIDNIISRPNRNIDYIFFSYHCNLSKKKYNGRIKDLSMLWDQYKLPGYEPDNTIIIDDYNKVTDPQPDISISAPAYEIFEESKGKFKFNVNNKNDTFLKDIVDTLKNDKKKLQKLTMNL